MADDLSIPRPGIRTTTTTTTTTAARPGRYGARQRAARPGMDPDVRRMALFAGGLGSVLAVLIGISALSGRHSGEVPVVTADERPVRVKPADPGGMKINAAENDVFSGGSDAGKARLGPAAENPDTAALRTAATDIPPADGAPAPSSDAAPAPVIQAAPKASPAPAVQVAPKASPAPAVQAAAPKASPAPVAQSTPKAPAATSKPVVTPAPAAAAPAAPAAHSATVQLAALTSEQAARTEWQALVKRMPDLLGGHQPSFSHVEHDGHTFWRVRTSGFADVAQARGFCEKVRAKGGGCSVTEF